MPRRAAKACRYPGCPGRARGGGWCEQHRPVQVDDRPSATRRGYGANWRRLRLLVLNREPLCRACATAGRSTPATDVDHITPKRDGGKDEMSNLQPLCKSCHSKKTGSGR